MNMLQKGAHSMRIIALPVARAKLSQGAKVNPYANPDADSLLVFYHFDQISSRGEHEDPSWHKKVLKNAMNKATDLWTSLGRAPKGSWKLWTYELGERVADRIEFEELALRSVDPSVGPAVLPTAGTSKQVNESQSLPKVPFIYPPALYPTFGRDRALHPALGHLQTHLATRGPRHRRGFYLWMLAAPLTIPIALIPLIPNLPLFFCVWRSWSHYRAYRSSQYLSSLLDRQLIKPNPSLKLDKLYASSTPPSTTSRNLPPLDLSSKSSENKSTAGNAATDRRSETASGTGESLPEGILLTPKALPLILAIFHIPESAAVNINRAIDQARERLGELR